MIYCTKFDFEGWPGGAGQGNSQALLYVWLGTCCEIRKGAIMQFMEFTSLRRTSPRNDNAFHLGLVEIYEEEQNPRFRKC